MDPNELSWYQDMIFPGTAGELVEFIYSCCWMSHAVPDFARLVGPMSEVLEEEYVKWEGQLRALFRTLHSQHYLGDQSVNKNPQTFKTSYRSLFHCPTLIVKK